jgi:hypothetical protein
LWRIDFFAQGGSRLTHGCGGGGEEAKKGVAATLGGGGTAAASFSLIVLSGGALRLSFRKNETKWSGGTGSTLSVCEATDANHPAQRSMVPNANIFSTTRKRPLLTLHHFKI